MNQDIVSTIRHIVKDELQKVRYAELGIVTTVFSHESDSDKNNYQCHVKLRDSELELQNVNIATQRVGAVAIPNVGDLVLVQFIGGHIDAPIVTGRVYNDEDRSPVAKPHEFVYVSPDSSESDIRRIYFEFPNSNTILLDDDKLELELGSTKITVNNSGDVTLEVSGKFSVQAQGDVEISAGGNIKLDASSGDINVNGINVNIKGQASAGLEASGSAKLKGANVAINGITSFGP